MKNNVGKQFSDEWLQHQNFGKNSELIYDEKSKLAITFKSIPLINSLVKNYLFKI
jgi:hypothetical protein